KKQPFIMAAAVALFALAGLAYYQESTEAGRLQKIAKEGSQKEQEVKKQEARFETAKKIDDVKDAAEGIASIASARDAILKIMDEINPNIPNNGDWAMKLDDHLWVVDWKFEEKEKPKDAASADPN